MKFICYPKCTTCKKASEWLINNSQKFIVRDIKQDNPSSEEIKEWYKKSGLPLKKFFNTSGLKYKELGLSKKILSMSEDEQIKLLAQDGMLLKRPILVATDWVLVGFKEKEWSETIL